MNITKTQIFRAVESLQREGFDIGCDSHSMGIAITNKAESRHFASRGTPAFNRGVLDGFEAGVNAERQRIKGQVAFMAWVRQHADQAEVAAFLSSIDFSL